MIDLRGKTLYVTDLDGTLLDSNATLSKETLRILKPLIKKGLPLVCCTARSSSITTPIIEELGCTFPFACYSGGLIYDFSKQHILRSFNLCQEQVATMLELGRTMNLAPFIYAIDTDNAEHVYYSRGNSPAAERYLADRLSHNDRRFYQDPSFTRWQEDTCFYVAFVGDIDELNALKASVESHQDVTTNLYESYYYEGLWWLEIMNHMQSKGNALNYLRQLYHADRVISFGDTTGDLSMIEAADIGIAVENAADKLKKAADIIIGPNTEDSVARFIAADLRSQA